jgi:hypothetical protein
VSTRPRRAVTRRKPVPGSLAYDAAEHIVTRREERAGERIGVEADDPAAVAAWVRRHPDGPAWMLLLDALDQLTIYEWQARELDRSRRDAIRLARRSGATWKQIAEALRLGSPQGAEQYWLALEELFEGPDGRRDDVAARDRLRPPPEPAETVAARRYTGLRDELRRLLDARQHLPADVDEQLGAYRGEVTRRAEMPDDQLARELRLLLDDVDPGALPTAVWVAVKRVLDATR